LPAVPDNRDGVDRWLDDVAPITFVGQPVKFDTKKAEYIVGDTDEVIGGDDQDFVARCDQVLVGYVHFHGKGNPPSKVLGYLFDGFTPPPRGELGETDEAEWEIGLSGGREDPWQKHQYLPIQDAKEPEKLYTIIAANKTSNRAVADLIRHYRRMRKTAPGYVPVIRLKVSGFNHSDQRIGWVATPMFVCVGKHPLDDVSVPNTSLSAQMNDDIPFN
jgi:hypothetical protein